MNKDENENEKISVLKVSADPEDISAEQRKKNVKKLAGAISHALRQNGEVNVRCFGNASIGKATKALAIAQSYIEENDIELSFSPAYINAEIGGKIRTGISFCVFANTGRTLNDTEDVASVLLVKGDNDDADYDEKNESVKRLAGAIDHAIATNNECVLRCFGNGTIGKASRALAMARGLVAQKGPDMYSACSFIEAEIGGKMRTGIAFYAYSNNI